MNTARNQAKNTPSAPSAPILHGIQFNKPLTREELRQLGTRVWRERGLALIDPTLIENDAARQALIHEATFLYGRHNTNASPYGKDGIK